MLSGKANKSMIAWKRLGILTGILVVCFHAGLSASPGKIFTQPRQVIEADTVAGEILVKFRELPEYSVRPVERVLPNGKIKLVPFKQYRADYPPYIDGLVVSRGCEILDYLQNLGVFRLRVLGEGTVEQAIADFEALPQVEYAEPNGVVQPAGYFHYPIPDDCFYDTDPRCEHLADTEVDRAWNAAEPLATLAKGLIDATIAVVDSGCNLTHEDAVGRAWPNMVEVAGLPGVDDDLNGFIDDISGWNFAGNNNDLSDASGHGSCMSGIAMARVNNTIHSAGVAWNPRLMVCKMDFGFATAAAGITYAADMGAEVILISYYTDIDNATHYNAIQYAYGMGCLLVGASGDTGIYEVLYPGAYPEVLSTAATNDTTLPGAEYNDNWMPQSTFNEYVDLAAPGGIWGVEGPLGFAFFMDSGCLAMWGTSPSSAQVAGLGAVLLSWPITRDDARYRIWKSSDDIQAVGYDQKSGHGRMNFYNAVGSLVPPQNPSLTEQPDKLALDWDVPNISPFGVDHYDVFRANVPGGPYGSIDSTSNSYYDDGTAVPGLDYYYVIKAVDARGLTTLACAEVSGHIITATATATVSPTSTITPTPTVTATLTVTPSVTPSATVTVTPSITPTVTDSATHTHSPTVTETHTVTVTATHSPVNTHTPTSTVSPTDTRSATPSVTLTATLSGTKTVTPTVTHSATPTVTLTESCTRTASASHTPSYTATETATASSTPTATPSVTPTSTRSPTRTASGTKSCSATVTATATPSRSASPTHTGTYSGTMTITATATPSRTATPSDTPLPSRTFTPTATISKTTVPSASSTVTITLTPGELKIEDHAIYPNPYQGGEGRIVYKLSAPCSSIRFKIFTTSGRLLVDREYLPQGYGGYEEIKYYGKDGLGNKLSNGVYLYVLEAYEGGAMLDRKVGKIAILR